jgi:hypothetical protein
MASGLRRAELALAGTPAERGEAHGRFLAALKAVERRWAEAAKEGRRKYREYLQIKARRIEVELERVRALSLGKKDTKEARALRKQRRDVGREELEVVENERRAGRGTIAERVGPSSRLLAAELGAAEKTADRRAAYQQHLDLVKEVEKAVAVGFEAGRVTRKEHARTKAGRVELEARMLQDVGGGGGKVRAAIEELLKEGRTAFVMEWEALRGEHKSGRPILGEWLAASGRWLAFDLAFARPADRLSAYRRHLERVKAVEQVVASAGVAPPPRPTSPEQLQMRLARIEAELLLLRGKE